MKTKITRIETNISDNHATVVIVRGDFRTEDGCTMAWYFGSVKNKYGPNTPETIARRLQRGFRLQKAFLRRQTEHELQEAITLTAGDVAHSGNPEPAPVEPDGSLRF